jgi:hypothetical protein
MSFAILQNSVKLSSFDSNSNLQQLGKNIGKLAAQEVYEEDNRNVNL